MTTEKKQKFIIDVAFAVIVALMVFITIKYVFSYILPFLLGFIIAYVTRPLVKKLSNFSRLNSKVSAIIILMLFYSIIGFAIFLLVLVSVNSLKSFFVAFPTLFENDIIPIVNNALQGIEGFISRIDPNLLQYLDTISVEVTQTLTTFVKNLSTGVISTLTNLITSVPSILLAFLFTVISSFFITIDYTKIINFFKLQMTDRTNEIMLAVHRLFSSTIFNFIKAYAILMTLTFVELAIGLSIIKIPNAIAVAFIIALIDVLPVLGTGGVMIPWFIIEFINGNTNLGVGLAIVYGIVTVIRNVVEPKVVGDQIGLYPLVTLFSMYVGTKLFGFIGLLGLPIFITIVNQLQKDGVIKVYKTSEKISNE